MIYRIFLIFFALLFLNGCKINSSKINYDKKEFTKYSNIGFTLIYDNFESKSVVSKKLDDRSLLIFNNKLKKNSTVKITNLLNDKSIIAKVKSNANYPIFYNSVISKRISDELEISLEEPYIKIVYIPDNSVFVAKKTKTFQEEKNVAEKVPVDGIKISNLNQKEAKKKNKKIKKFSYSIKISDFYYQTSAKLMQQRILNELSINVKIIKISQNKYRVFLGPFDDINSLKDSFNKLNSLEFDKLEIIKNL